MSALEVIRGAYLADLLAQPAAIEATVEGLSPSAALLRVAERAAAGRYRRVVLTGMGASLHALHPLALRLVAHGATAMMVETSELVHAMPALLDDGTLIVAVSQSGRSAEVVRLVEHAGRRADLVGVTNAPGSPLAARADATVPLRAGEESSVSCKTWVATIAALVWLGDLLCDGQPARGAEALAGAAAAVRGYLDVWERHVAALLPLVDGVRDLFFAGRGASLGAALTAGLILKESARVHAEGMSSAALRHGPIEMMSDRVLALVYEGEGAVAGMNRALVDDLRRAGARAVLCGAGADEGPLRLPAVPPAIRPLVEILPAQMTSLALAALGGFEAGRFRHATKVTVTE